MAIDEHAEAVDALYDLHPSEFVAARNDLAKRIRADDREASDEIRKLTKPSVAAWALNTAAGRRADDVEELRSTGPAAARAQQTLQASSVDADVVRSTKGKDEERQRLRTMLERAEETVGDTRDRVEQVRDAVAKAEEDLRQASTVLEEHEHERDRRRAELDALG